MKKQINLWKKWLLGTTICLLLILSIELIYCNRAAMGLVKEKQPTELSLANVAYSQQVQAVQAESGTVLQVLQTDPNTGPATVEFSGLALSDVEEISIVGRSLDDNGALCFVTVQNQDDATKYIYQEADKKSFLNRDAFAVRTNLSTYGKTHAIQLVFQIDTPASFEILSVTLNPPHVFSFQWARALFWFVLLTGIYSAILCIKEKSIHTIEYDAQNRRHRIAARAALAVCMAVALLLAAANGTPKLLTVEELHATGRADANTAYAWHFSAMLHGQSSLELTPDPDLEKLDNVYDASERDAKNVDYLRDYAYYNGKYYCYFGVAPIAFVLLPIYLLTHTIASDALVCGIFLVMTIFFLYAACEEMLRTFRIKTSLLMRVAGAAALSFGSAVYAAFGASMYNVAVLSGTCFSAAFAYFAYKAYNTARVWPRRLCFFAAGLAAFGIVGSRPIAALMAVAFALPLFVSVLAERGRALRAKLWDSVSFLVPAVLGCGAILYYNEIRFGSPFDFGVLMQMTIYDAHAYKVVLTPAALWQAFSVYFVGTNVRYTAAYPFVRFDRLVQPLLGRYTYQNIPAFSAFSMPLIFGWLGLPVACSTKKEKKHALQTAVYVLISATALLCAFLAFCLGGIDMRYQLDFFPALCLLAVLILMQLSYQYEQKGTSLATGISVVLCALTVCTGSVMTFYALQQSPAFYQALSHIFTIPV